VNTLIRYTLSLLTIAGLFIFTGCFALPQEETLPPPPVMRTPEARPPRTFLVQRGDVELFVSPRATYLPLQEETLYFTVANQWIRGVFVRFGDKVQEGDILAELNRPDVLRNLEQAEWDLQSAQLDLRQLNERHALRLNIATTSGIPFDDSEIIYERNRISGRINYLNLRIEHLRAEEDAMRLRAPFDGVVTWVMDHQGVMFTAVGQAVVTIANQEQYVFYFEGPQTQYINIGDMIELNSRGEIFMVRVIDPDAYGIEAPPVIGDALPRAFLIIEGEPPVVGPSVHFTLRIIQDARHDVVFLPRNHVNTVGERTWVNILEDDVIVLRDIVVGLIGNNHVEILSGLDEGDVIVL